MEYQFEPLLPSNESISTPSYSVHFSSIVCILLRSYSLLSYSTSFSSISSEQSESKSLTYYLFLEGDKEEDPWELREMYKSFSSGIERRSARKKAWNEIIFCFCCASSVTISPVLEVSARSQSSSTCKRDSI